VAQAQAEVPPTYPREGWVEHDPEAIAGSVGPLVSRALGEAGVSGDRVAAVGLTNQRETTIVWERSTGRAIGPAIVWQDRRTADACERLRDHAALVSSRSGLVLDPYFSATKIAWLLDHVPGARSPSGARRARGRDRRQPAHLAPHGRDPPRHRRDQRLANPADGPPLARLGSGTL
jgi:glycerol kinase